MYKIKLTNAATTALLEWNTKVVKTSVKFCNKCNVCPKNLTLWALLDFQPTVKVQIAFGQKWIKFPLATHINFLSSCLKKDPYPWKALLVLNTKQLMTNILSHICLAKLRLLLVAFSLKYEGWQRDRYRGDHKWGWSMLRTRLETEPL